MLNRYKYTEIFKYLYVYETRLLSSEQQSFVHVGYIEFGVVWDRHTPHYTTRKHTQQKTGLD